MYARTASSVMVSDKSSELSSSVVVVDAGLGVMPPGMTRDGDADGCGLAGGLWLWSPYEGKN